MAFAAFLPALQPRKPPAVERIAAGLLLSDISGFTALTEQLQARGRQGAEETTAVVSSVFAPAIRAIHQEGGSVVSFGGDSLFAMFPGARGASSAADAGRTITRALEARGPIATSAGAVRLGVRQAVHHGVVHLFHLGTADRRHLLFTGASVATLARLEASAAVGEIRLSASARRQPAAPARRQRSGRPASPRQIRAYLPPRLVPLLGTFAGEYRRAAVLFLETPTRGLRVMQEWYLHLAGVLDRYDGLLLKTDLSPHGTRWLCVFGIPAAHEEDPDRAARAAIEAREGAPRGLPVRGGLHAGTLVNVVIGPRTRKSFDVMGDVVNTAARAAAVAVWGEVLITAGVREALAGVDTEERGAHAVKGKERPLVVHALRRAHRVTRTISVSRALVGRERELRTIAEALSAAASGHGGAIAVSGEAGIGKSRMKHEATELARRMGFHVHEGGGVSFGGRPYGAISGLLRSALGLVEEPDAAAVQRAVTDAAASLGLAAVDRDHLADVMGCRFDGSPLRHLDGATIRTNNAIAIGALFAALARRAPQLLVLEDMHWSDESARACAAWLARTTGPTRILLLLLHRPDFRPPPEAIQIALSELDPDAVAAMLGALLGDAPEPVTSLVRERAGGNPFFVEEVVRHLLETGLLVDARLSKDGPASGRGYRLVRAPASDELPETVETLIEARLGSLPVAARRAAQLASVVGQTLDLDLFEALDRRSAAAVGDLVARGFLHRTGEHGGVRLAFKHALTRDAAYGTILVARRRKLHRAVARVMEGRLAERRSDHLPELGHHYEQAGMRRQAHACYLGAASAAGDRCAYAETVRLAAASLDLVSGPSVQTGQARSIMGVALMHLGRRPEAREAHRAALDDARAVGSPGRIAECLVAVARTELTLGNPQEALALATAAREQARDAGDAERMAMAVMVGAMVEDQLGRSREAREGLLVAAATFRELHNDRQLVSCLMNLGGIEHHQGRTSEALALYDDALATAARLRLKDVEAVVVGNLANLQFDLGALDEATRHYERALAIHLEVGNRMASAIDMGNLAGVHSETGQWDRAATLYQQSLAIGHELADTNLQAWNLMNLSELSTTRGDLATAARLAESALPLVRQAQETRLEGMLLVRMATIRRRTGDLAAARESADSARAILAECDRFALAKALCELGFVELALGADAAALLAQARTIARELGVSDGSPVSRGIEDLARAIDAASAGRSLVWGEAPSPPAP